MRLLESDHLSRWPRHSPLARRMAGLDGLEWSRCTWGLRGWIAASVSPLYGCCPFGRRSIAGALRALVRAPSHPQSVVMAGMHVTSPMYR